MVTMHVSLDKANHNTINLSTPDFHIWQHIDSNRATAHIQKLADITEITVTELYKHMIVQSELILPFEINRVKKEGPPPT